MVGDQRQQAAATLLDVPLAEALDRQPVAEERVGRVVGEAALQQRATGGPLGHESLGRSRRRGKPNFPEQSTQATYHPRRLSTEALLRARRVSRTINSRHCPAGKAVVVAGPVP